MKVNLDKAQGPLQKLRKLIRNFPADPTPDDVHKLRTQARRLEAIVHALSSERDKQARRLLKAVKPLRKAAGEVRDLDVLIAKVFSIAGAKGSNDESLMRLTEHMAALRKKSAARLYRAVDRRGKKAAQRLKQYRKRIKREGDGAQSPAAPEILVTELEHWPRLHKDNLHEFRIHAKELRYMLQLAPDADPLLMEKFERVKDASGDWHDWVELGKLAGSVLDAEEDRAILRHIENTSREKLRTALAAANALRRNGLHGP